VKLNLFLAGIASVGAMLLASPPEASAISPGCRLHLERVEAATGRHVSAAEDRRHWLSQGQKPMYCSEADANEASNGTVRERSEEPRKETSEARRDLRDDEGKSRFCRKRWWC
jgi:hypothetical protein